MRAYNGSIQPHPPPLNADPHRLSFGRIPQHRPTSYGSFHTRHTTTATQQPQPQQQPFSLFVAKQQDQIIPSLEDFVPIYPPQTHPDIQRIIASKKEFLTFKAKTGEPMPQRGELFAHQKLFERLILNKFKKLNSPQMLICLASSSIVKKITATVGLQT